MSLIVKYPNAGTIPELLENIKDMAIQMPSAKEYENLKSQVEGFETRIAAMEAKFTAGITDSTHYVCNDNNTYGAAESKTITITDGIITAIET